MKKIKSKTVYSILIRYLFLILIALPNLAIFYFIFKPLTIYPVFFLLNIFYNPSLVGETIRIGILNIEVINACVAGSAFYLLTVLNLATPKLKIEKRIRSLLFILFSFLILNILRIFVLSVIAVEGLPIFDVTHQLLWYLGSTLFVILIWFASVKIFKIKGIPFYSDLKFLYNKIRKK